MKERINKYTCKVATSCHHLSSNIVFKYLNNDLIQKEPHKYLYTILFKTINALDTANILTNNIVNKPTSTDSLFIILRATISDLIIYDFLLRTSNNNDDEFEYNIDRMYCDQISHTIKDMKFYRSAYKKSEKEINKKIDDLKLMYPKYFGKNGEEIIKPLKLTVSFMTKEIIKQRETDENLEYLITARALYDKFSKHEHFGVITLDIIHRQFNNERLNEIFQDIFWANKIILRYVDNIIGFWINNKNEDYLIFDKLRAEISDLKWIQ